MKVAIGRLSFALLFLTCAGSAQVFTITDLGENIFPVAINKPGVVAANMVPCDCGLEFFAGTWNKQRGFEPLPVSPDANPSSVAFGINNLGDVAGLSDQENGMGSAALWPHQGGVTVLASFDGLFNVWATAVNDAGQVTGIFDDGAFIWTTATGFTNLGVVPGQINPYPTAIDKDGAVVGTATDTTDNMLRSWIWTPGNGIKPINSLPPGSMVTGIRNGAATGSVCDADCENGTGTAYSFVWRAHHGPRFFGKSSGQLSYAATALNHVQQVVGSATLPGFTPAFAFLWTTSGTIYNLNQLVRAPGWVLTTASGINDNAQIVGSGTLNGVTHGYLLTVIPKKK